MENKKYDTRHGGPWDRGNADFYYHRPRQPHFYLGDTAQSTFIPTSEMTDEQIEAYHAGYDQGEADGVQKES